MPTWLAWLLPVPVATLGAIAYASWSMRVRGPEEAMDSVASYDRFRSAMANPAVSSRASDPVSGPVSPVPAPRDRRGSTEHADRT